MNVVGYLRVSSDRQSVESQKTGIVNYCEAHQLEVKKWVEETVSGAKDYRRRKLGGILPMLRKGDTLIVSEISRLGRTIKMVVGIIESLLKRGVRIVLVKQAMSLDPNSKEAFSVLQTTVFITVFAMCAQIERELLIARVTEGVRRSIAKGSVWKHAVGPHKSKIAKLVPTMLEYRSRGLNNYTIAKKLKISPCVVTRYIGCRNRPPELSREQIALAAS